VPLLVAMVHRRGPERAFVEFVCARPGEGVLGALAIPVTWITAPSGKRCLGLGFANKDAACSEAIKRWPKHASLFSRKMDDGRAEAALIAVAGILRSATP
jgi:crossover junction endodeoxyribonuclease RuvC